MMPSNDPEDVVYAELGEGETLLWSGRPRLGVLLRPSDAFAIPFSLLWGGFAIFWETTVVRSHAPFFFLLWGIPFVLIGLYMIVGRFFYEAKQRENTSYGVTSQRILLVSGMRQRTVKSLPLRTLSDVTLAENKDGRGTITFGPPTLLSRGRNGTAWPGTSSQMPPSFDMISDPRSVYDIIRKAQREDERR